MIIDLNQYRTDKNSVSQYHSEASVEQNCQSSPEKIELLDRSMDHPAILEALQRANKRCW